MKKTLVILLAAGILFVGCGNSEDVTENENEVTVTEEKTDVNDASEDEIEEEVEVSKIELLQQFVAGDVTATSNFELELWSYDGENLINFEEGADYSIDEIKSVTEKSSWDNPAVYYSYFREDSDNPFLIILVPDNPNYIDENNCLLVFNVEDDGVHITDYLDTMEDEYTSIYVGIDGLISTKAYPLGMSSGSLVSAVTYVIDDGKMNILFSEGITDMSAYEWIEDDTGIGQILTEVYANSDSWPSVGELELNGKNYYILYSDGLDVDADLRFKNRCAEIGINIQNRNELISLCEEYAKGLGYEIDLNNMDANIAEWTQL